MKNPKTKCVLITHFVNPHQFYFKYTNDSVNSEYSNFDFEIQLYGNKLHSNKTYKNGYLPSAENEIVIVFNVIFNKWVRGRVVSIGQEIILWCIDSGISVKCAASHILPLPQRFHEDMKLVHLGGLSLLPTEKILNVKTVEVEKHLSPQWDAKTISLVKGIINRSETFMFTEEFDLMNHKFGLLAIESKSAKSVNNILIEMNIVTRTQYADEDLRSYVCEVLIEKHLHQSLNDGSTIQAKAYHCTNTLSKEMPVKCGSTMSSNENVAFNDSVSRKTFDSTKSSYESAQAIVSICNTLPSQCTAAKVSLIVGYLKNECYENFDGSMKTDMPSTATTANSSSRRPNGSNGYECLLSKSQSDFTKESRQPLQTAKTSIDPVRKSTSSENIFLQNKSRVSRIVHSVDNRRSQLFSPKLFAKNAPPPVTETCRPR